MVGIHDLDRLFNLRSIAVFGASEQEGTVGALLFHNLLYEDFVGDIYAINPKYETVMNRPCYPSLDAVGRPVDLAIIATPARTVPGILDECGQHGVKAAVVLSAGFAEAGPEGVVLQESLLDATRRHDIRVLGPNCLGLMRPNIGLNATFSHGSARPGDLALLSQSGALCTAILDWAETRQVGFSAVVSLGAAADVDFGDLLDYLALDPQTKSILLYVEGVKNPRHFISGLRCAARIKPVIVVKAGRYAEDSRAIKSHTGALVGGDDVFDAALKRTGAVRALTIGRLFAAAQILSSGMRVRGNRLAIVTNGGGPGVMATDLAVKRGLEIVRFSEKTCARLSESLPPQWSYGNPVDILGDAPPERYQEAVAACLNDPNVDGVLVLLTPQAMTQPTEAAHVVVEAARQSQKPVLASWMGDTRVAEARQIFSDNKLPHFVSPELSVEAFACLASYHANQQLLPQVPGPLSTQRQPDVEGARLIIEGVLAEGRTLLDTIESKAVLAAFRIPIAQAVEAATANQALIVAETLGFPVAMKINSLDISHKSEVGGVRLNLLTPQSVRRSFSELVAQAKERQPDAVIKGVTVEPMYRSASKRELMVGVVRDPVFGPVVSFGSGGTAMEILRDRALALPPLNRFIIEDLISRTRVSRLLEHFRNLPPVKREALIDVLQRVSEMVCELPHIVEMDINPLIADEHGTIATDARIVVDYHDPSTAPYAHIAIHPYPADLIEHWQMADGTDITVRPIRPEDADIEQDFIRNLSPESRYFRFMQNIRELTPAMLVRFTQIDYDRELALIGVYQKEGQEVQIGVVRYVIQPDGQSCEFALVIADDWNSKGIGQRLLRSLMWTAKKRGLTTMQGEVLSNNHRMLSLIKDLGFSIRLNADDAGIQNVSKIL